MPNKLSNIKLEEVSLVDRPANKGARVVLFKRQKPTDGIDIDRLINLCKSIHDDDRSPDFVEALEDELVDQGIFDINDELWPFFDALRESVIVSASEMTGDVRDAKIRENVEQFLSHVEDKLNEMSADASQTSVTAGDTGSSTKGLNDMTIEELKKKLGEMEKQLADMTKERDDAVAKVDGAKDTGADLIKAAKEAGVEIVKNNDGSYAIEVEKTKEKDDDFIEFNGERVLKSAVPAPVLKALETQQKSIDDLRGRQESVDLAKRVESEIPNLSGSVEHKSEIIKAIDGIEDEDTRKAVFESLKAADAAVSKVFAEIGNDPNDDDASATSRLNKMAKDHASENNCTFEQGLAAVIKTPDGAKLRKQVNAESN